MIVENVKNKDGKLIFKIKILILRVLYRKTFKVAILKYLSLKFSTFRPHYETILYGHPKLL